jgi:hypothetical protein
MPLRVAIPVAPVVERPDNRALVTTLTETNQNTRSYDCALVLDRFVWIVPATTLPIESNRLQC